MTLPDADAQATNEHDKWVAYWNDRFDLIYYQAVDYIIRTVGASATSLLDVGTGGCPYLEWFDWIEQRVSIDIRKPYASANVQGLNANILTDPVPDGFELCTCLQVLEHVPDAGPFARRLTELARTVVVSVPFKWPEGKTQGHVHDPVDLEKLSSWFGRPPNYHMTVQEPLRRTKNVRLIAIYDRDPKRVFGADLVSGRRPKPARVTG
ncbi:class I SAM-dependent methyltransferase [Aquabacter sp. P-9]|uniref:class I SAM-dependent methyltransferase n=1 Tax=Aquabacter sediminis TaxID=3029197 RepID=UPI00237DA647|nr:hypothetical protein [Aquabacter sp. P-9]MDE1568018.1 hypothetical protein [Aquabacter sp. P-9]